MANINESLASLMDIDGAGCAAIVDSNSGMLLGSMGSGMDIMLAAAGNTEVVRAKMRTMQSLQQLPVPVIARVHGVATAAGCQLVASCDLAVAVDTARFAVSGITVGLYCATPAVALTRNVSRKRCAIRISS